MSGAGSIALRRLVNQQLVRSAFTRPADVVEWLGAVQGQDYAGAKWSLGLRLPGSTDADIEQALADRAIVRTWALRGTLHLVAAADLRWLLELVRPRVTAGNARRYRELELDPPTLRRSSSLLAAALRDGRHLDRKALFAALERHGISTRGQRGVYMLQRASLEGLICQGQAPRNNPTFMALDGSLPRGKTLEREEALGELARRYFKSRGPAALDDFVWWSGLPTSEARAGLGAIQSELVKETVDRREYWFPPANRPPRANSSRAFLLPGFDEYLLGYRDRSASVGAETQRLIPPANGMLSPKLVIDGQVVGTWKRTIDKGAVVIALRPFTRDEAEGHAIQTAARRFGDFLQMPVRFI